MSYNSSILQKILKMWQNKGLMKNFKVVEVLTSLLNLFIMFSWLWTFSQIRETCLLKFNWLLIFIPKRLSEYLVVKEKWWSVDLRTMAWRLSALMIMRFSVQHASAIYSSCCMHKSRLTGLQSHAVIRPPVICIHVKFHFM